MQLSANQERFDPLENRTLEELNAAEDDVSEEDFLQQSLGRRFERFQVSGRSSHT